MTRNALIDALKREHPSWTHPPTNDSLLVWRFCVAESDCGVGAQSYEPSGGTSARRPDDKLVGRLVHEPGMGYSHDDLTCPLPQFLRGTRLVGKRSVGFAGDGERPAAKLERVDRLLAQLELEHRAVLWWAYGPNKANREGEVVAKLGQWWGVAITGKTAAHAFEVHRSRLREKYSALRRDMPLDASTRARRELAAMEGYLAASSERQAALALRLKWFLHEAGKELQEQVRREAEAAVYEAWNRWADGRGRRKRFGVAA